LGRSAGAESPGANAFGNSAGPLAGALPMRSQPSMSASHSVGDAISASPIDDPASATQTRAPTSIASADVSNKGASSPTSTVSLYPLPFGSLASTSPQTALEQPVGASVRSGAPEMPARGAIACFRKALVYLPDSNPYGRDGLAHSRSLSTARRALRVA